MVGLQFAQGLCGIGVELNHDQWPVNELLSHVFGINWMRSSFSAGNSDGPLMAPTRTTTSWKCLVERAGCQRP